ncbi:LamG domain-containing protein [Flavobacterium aquidurense]|uniref:LamG domain-containing protein n=1 Tax=Flavobacterium aquidurense TaxID=362413 RepID=UPI002864B238|nr:LamG domain-containing protein [Flavobacterium aquidurense]MDR7370618.1 hypothetical protein [Flavobacterium aquidurense]
MKKILLATMFVSFLSSNAQNPIQEFSFNGTLNNIENTTSFMGANNFVTDRKGVANGAQRLVNKGMEAVIDDLPQNNTARTISIWVKFNDISSANYIWGYGAAYNAQYCGLLHQGTNSANSNLNMAGWGISNDIILSIPLEKNVWYNYSFTYDNAVSKIYRNGQLIKAVPGIIRATKGNIFRLGEINTTVGINADIDDLKIFNVALTDEQVAEQYNSSKPAEVLKSAEVAKNSKTAKTNVVAKSTPTNTINKTSDVNSVSKNIEVFSQGQKIIGSNNGISINDLPEGTYLLKITNKPTTKVTSK